MNGGTGPSLKIDFGKFVLNLSTRELKKGRVNLRLPDQAIRILEILIEEPGRVVTREEIQSRIWGEQPPADPVHGLNVTMNRLRAALGDSAKDPRYIETIPRTGYRFIGPISVETTAVQVEAAGEVSGTEAGAVALPLPTSAASKWRGIAGWGGALLLAAGAIVFWASRARRRPGCR